MQDVVGVLGEEGVVCVGVLREEVAGEGLEGDDRGEGAVVEELTRRHCHHRRHHCHLCTWFVVVVTLITVIAVTMHPFFIVVPRNTSNLVYE